MSPKPWVETHGYHHAVRSATCSKSRSSPSEPHPPTPLRATLLNREERTWLAVGRTPIHLCNGATWGQWSILGWFGKSKETGEKISQSLRGRSLSKEHKDRIREVRLGTKASEGTKRKMSESANNKRSIICTETGKVYESVNMASRLMGIGDTNIRQCAKGIQYTAGGYHWQYVT